MKIDKRLPTTIQGAESQKTQETKGLVLPSVFDEPRRVLNRIADHFDAALGVDPAGPKNITLAGVADADFAAMEAKVAKMGGAGSPSLDEPTRVALDAGKVVATYRPLGDGVVHERSMAVIDMPLDQFLQKMPLADWGSHLAGWKGGETKAFSAGKQIERMVITAPGKDNDMTKVESLNEERDASGKLTASSVHWEVLKSDNGTVVTDVGSLRFERYGEKTLAVFDSAHKLNIYPGLLDNLPATARDNLIGNVLTDTFAQHLRVYQNLAKSP